MFLPENILNAVPRGCFNLHASLLPRWRGAAPIPRAIMTGDAESGAMVMKMDVGLDTGDVAKFGKLEAKIDWTKPAREVLRHIHGLSPFPGAWFEVPSDGAPVRIKVLRCALAQGSSSAP